MPTSGSAVTSRAPVAERELLPPAENVMQVQAVPGMRAAPAAAARALEGDAIPPLMIDICT
jgi:hypothetical protein